MTLPKPCPNAVDKPGIPWTEILELKFITLLGLLILIWIAWEDPTSQIRAETINLSVHILPPCQCFRNIGTSIPFGLNGDHGADLDNDLN